MPYFYRLLIACILSILPLVSGAELSDKNPEKLKSYYLSGQYFREMQRKLDDAKDYMDRQLQTERANHLAMILDIDETALSNYHDLERLGFTQNKQALTAAFMLGGATAISPVLELYQYAIQNGVHVFFISERPQTPEIIAMTVKNLKQAGFTQWQDLLLKPLDSKQSDQEFKMASRRHIALQDYDIIMNIGDQESDLKGGYAEIKVKIPNPFYS